MRRCFLEKTCWTVLINGPYNGSLNKPFVVSGDVWAAQSNFCCMNYRTKLQCIININRDFYLDVYTILNRIKLTTWTICAFRILNPRKWSLVKESKWKSWKIMPKRAERSFSQKRWCNKPTNFQFLSILTNNFYQFKLTISINFKCFLSLPRLWWRKATVPSFFFLYFMLFCAKNTPKHCLLNG